MGFSFGFRFRFSVGLGWRRRRRWWLRIIEATAVTATWSTAVMCSRVHTLNTHVAPTSLLLLLVLLVALLMVLLMDIFAPCGFAFSFAS